MAPLERPEAFSVTHDGETTDTDRRPDRGHRHGPAGLYARLPVTQAGPPMSSPWTPPVPTGNPPRTPSSRITRRPTLTAFGEDEGWDTELGPQDARDRAVSRSPFGSLGRPMSFQGQVLFDGAPAPQRPRSRSSSTTRMAAAAVPSELNGHPGRSRPTSEGIFTYAHPGPPAGGASARADHGRRSRLGGDP